MRAPSDGFDGSLVLRKSTNRVDGGICGPDEKLVVVPSWCQQLGVRWPLQAANFLFVSALLEYVLARAIDIPLENLLVPGARRKEILREAKSSDSTKVAFQRLFKFLKIKNYTLIFLSLTVSQI
jgi:hypothetical protein